MEYLVYYGIFVFATLIVVMHSIMSPVVNELYTTIPKPKITTDIGNKTLLYVVLAIITILLAPIMFLVWILPNASRRFKEVILVELKKS